MSSRLRRPPSGRNNLSQRDNSNNNNGSSSARPMTPGPGGQQRQPSPRYPTPREHTACSTSSARPASASSLSRQHSSHPPPSPIRSSKARAGPSYGLDSVSARSSDSDGCIIICSDRSNIQTREVMARLRNKHADEERRKASEETLLMSEYNPFSRPRPSSAVPLRSSFLDPETNNFFPSKTRSELMQRIKLASMPHPSYDIDGDGWVSQEDYKLAKRFDFDGNGVIDPHERKIAKSVITDEFFKAHRDNLNVFGDKIASATHAENVNAVVNATNFERTFGLLKGMEESLKGRASKEMLGCMDGGVHKGLTKHNFYTNKFDTCAWTDFDAVPRTHRTQNPGQHKGSRRRLLEGRKAQSRLEGDCFHRQATAKDKTIHNHRISLISNFALEN